MTVSDDGGKGRLTWSCVFEPNGVSEEEAARDLQQRYGAVINVIEAYLVKEKAEARAEAEAQVLPTKGRA
jgi:hypothetical protein